MAEEVGIETPAVVDAPEAPKTELTQEQKDAAKEGVTFSDKSDDKLREELEKAKQEKEAKALLEEIQTKIHPFSIDSDKRRLAFTWPSTEQSRIAEWKYSEAFTEAADANLKTADEMLEWLKNKKRWTDEDEKELDLLRVDYIKTDAKYRGDTSSEVAKLERRKAREVLLTKQAKKQKFLAHTVENKAEEVKNGYLLSQITIDFETKKPCWKSYEEYLEDKNKTFLYQVQYEYTMWSNGIPESFLEE